MPHRVVEELRTHNPNIILNGLEEAKEVLILNGMSLEEILEFLDLNGWDIWHNNKDSLSNTITNVLLEWNQESQTLTRTFEFENEELYEEYRYMCNSIFPSHEREFTLKEVTPV